MTEDAKEKWFNSQVDDILKHKKLPLSPIERAILRALAAYADQSGKCCLYLDDIAFYVGIDRTNVPRYLKTFKEKKIITVKTHYKKGTKCMTKSTYIINIKALIELSTDANGTPIVTGCRHTDVTIEPLKETIIDQNHSVGVVRVTTGCRQGDGVVLRSNPKATQELTSRAIVRGETSDTSNLVQFNSDRGFDDFYAAYPRKEKRKEAHAAWLKHKLDKLADEIIEDVRQRQIKHVPWLQGREFIPLPSAYLNGERWNDEIIENGVNANGSHQQAGSSSRADRESKKSALMRKGFDDYEQNRNQQ